MANLSDQAFTRDVLHQGLGVRHVSVGFDISFGKGRTGSPESMAAYGQALGFGVSIAPPIGGDDEKYSSTAVRNALREGRPQDAAAVLGRPFSIEGMVIHGRKLGRTIGFPTANIALEDYVAPRFGVYATRTRLPDGREIAGVANIGVNPTVGEVQARLEVWLFDFDEDLYDQTLETDLVAFLRPEARFDGLDAMVAQIHEDARQARALLLPEL
jgi:riboflavin kinase/FMN adenylyltransferase